MEYQFMVSVIVPVYNSDKYLVSCLESLCAQEYQDFEVLLIDDGSVDGSEKLCREYETGHPQIRYFRQNHAGVSAARNYGLGQARGKYLLFVDSDDFVSPTYVGTLVRRMEEKNVGLVVTDYYQFSDTEQDIEHWKLKANILSPRDYLKKMSPCPGAHFLGVLWNKIYHTEIAGQLSFSNSLNLGEDFVFNMEYFCLLPDTANIQIIEEKVYYYRFREGSLSNKIILDITESKTRQILYQSYRRAFQSRGMEEVWKWRIEFYIVKAYFDDERKWIACGAGKEQLKELYHQYITVGGISRLRFRMFCLLRIGKHVRDWMMRKRGKEQT